MTNTPDHAARAAARVFIIDDDDSICKALMRLLTASGHTTEVFHSADDYLKREPFDGIGCLILDIRMPGMSGTDLQIHLQRRQNSIAVVFLTGHGDLPAGIEAMKRGAVDFLTKPVDEIALLDAVDRALSRSQQVHDERSRRANVQSRLDTLTPREIEVLEYVVGGARNKQIALYLGISEKTVKAHRGVIMRKMGASSPAEVGWLCSLVNLPIRK
jgi:FixJ family two-component response regulator